MIGVGIGLGQVAARGDRVIAMLIDGSGNVLVDSEGNALVFMAQPGETT